MKKQITGGIILSFFSQIIGIIVGLVYTPVMIKSLGQNEYGLYQLVLSVINYLNLMNLGFNGAYIRYYVIARTKGDDNEVANVNGMFMRVFLVIACLCLFAGIVLLFNINVLGNQLTTNDYVIARKLLIIMVINLAISFPNSLYVAFMSANERFVYQKAIGILLNIAIPILNIPLLYMGFGSVGVVSVTLLLTVIRLILNMWYCYVKLEMKINIKYFDNLIFKELLGYTFFIFLSDIVDQLNSNVDKFLLGRIIGTIPVAIYSVGYNLKNYYTTVSWIVPEMYVPKANRLVISNSDSEDLTDVFTKVGKINNYLMLLVLSGFILIGRQFVNLWVGNEYDISYFAALILMLAGYIPAIQTLGVNIQNAKNMHKMRSIVYFLIACFNVLISIVLINKWGVVGTCLGTLFATLIGHGFFMNWYYHKRIGLNVIYFWKEMLKWIVPVVIMTFIGYVLLQNIIINNWFKLISIACIYGLIYIIVLFIVELDYSQKSIVMSKLKAIIK